MPRYDYICRSCNKEFEKTHSYKFKDVTCIYCKSNNVEKLLKTIGRVVKGVVHKDSKTKKGELVNQAIQDGKKDLKTSKKDIKGRVFKK